MAQRGKTRSCGKGYPLVVTPMAFVEYTEHSADARIVKNKGVNDMGYRLCDLAPGQWGVVAALGTEGGMRRRLLDLGLVEGTEVRCVGRSPAGDPSAYLIRGAVIAIRAVDAVSVELEEVAGDV